MTMSCILALLCPLAGSKWYFNYSYTCGNTCIGLIYASFDPSLDIVSVEEIFKNLYPNDPSDEFFFCTYKIVSTGLTVDGCASILLGKLPSMPSYVLRCSLPNVH